MQASPEFKEEGMHLCALYSEAYEFISHAIDLEGIAPQLNEWRAQAAFGVYSEIRDAHTTSGTEGGGSTAQEQQEPQQPSEDPPATETNQQQQKPPEASRKRQQQQQQEPRLTRQQRTQQHQEEADAPQQQSLPLKKRGRSK